MEDKLKELGLHHLLDPVFAYDYACSISMSETPKIIEDIIKKKPELYLEYLVSIKSSILGKYVPSGDDLKNFNSSLEYVIRYHEDTLNNSKLESIITFVVRTKKRLSRSIENYFIRSINNRLLYNYIRYVYEDLKEDETQLKLFEDALYYNDETVYTTKYYCSIKKERSDKLEEFLFSGKFSFESIAGSIYGLIETLYDNSRFLNFEKYLEREIGILESNPESYNSTIRNSINYYVSNLYSQGIISYIPDIIIKIVCRIELFYGYKRHKHWDFKFKPFKFLKAINNKENIDRVIEELLTQIKSVNGDDKDVYYNVFIEMLDKQLDFSESSTIYGTRWKSGETFFMKNTVLREWYLNYLKSI